MVAVAKLFYGFVFNIETEELDFWELADKYYGNKRIPVDIGACSDHYDRNDMYIHIKDSIKSIDEEEGWVMEVNISKEQNTYTAWNQEIEKICEENNINYKQPSWHLMIDNF